MKKAQGLPFSTLVVAIIAIFILVIIVAWASGAFGKVFGQAGTLAGISEADVTAAQTKCNQYCLQAQTAEETEDWTKSDYCTKIFKLDEDGDGTITDKDENEGLLSSCIDDDDEFVCCWESPISTACSASHLTLTEADCNFETEE